MKLINKYKKIYLYMLNTNLYMVFKAYNLLYYTFRCYILCFIVLFETQVLVYLINFFSIVFKWLYHYYTPNRLRPSPSPIPTPSPTQTPSTTSTSLSYIKNFHRNFTQKFFFFNFNNKKTSIINIFSKSQSISNMFFKLCDI